jgi:hypothetical protein
MHQVGARACFGKLGAISTFNHDCHVVNELSKSR